LASLPVVLFAHCRSEARLQKGKKTVGTEQWKVAEIGKRYTDVGAFRDWIIGLDTGERGQFDLQMETIMNSLKGKSIRVPPEREWSFLWPAWIRGFCKH